MLPSNLPQAVDRRRVPRDGVWRGPYRTGPAVPTVDESLDRDQSARMSDLLERLHALCERDPAAALVLSEDALSLASELQLHADEGWVWWMRARAFWLKGAHDLAVENANQGIAISDHGDEPLLYAALLNIRASAQQESPDFTGVLRDYEWALSAASEAQEPSLEIAVIGNLAVFLTSLGLYSEALQLVERAESAYDGSLFNDRRRVLFATSQAYAQASMARDAYERRAVELVRPCAEAGAQSIARALSLIDSIYMPYLMASTYVTASELALWRGDVPMLEEIAERAQRLQDLTDVPHIAHARWVSGAWLLFGQGRFAEAIDPLQKAIDSCAPTSLLEHRHWHMLRLSEAYAHCGRWDHAHRALEQYYRASHERSAHLQTGIAALARLRQQAEREHSVDYLTHDLRGMLTSLRIVTDPRFGETKPLSLDVPSAAQLVDRAVVQLDQFIDFIRSTDLSRSNLIESELHQLLGDVVAARRRSAQARGVQIQYEPAEEIDIKCHRSMLIRAFDGLLDNALRYSPVGATVAVTLEVDERDRAVVRITDGGAGFPSARLVLPFAMPRARMAPHGGYGLGLPFAGRVVEAHGGTLTLANRAVGAEVCVTIPCA